MDEKTYFRSLLLYAHHRKLTAAAAHQELQETYGAEAPSLSTCKRWMNKFTSGSEKMEDQPRAGRPATVMNKDLQQLLEEDPGQSSRQLGEQLGCHQKTVLRHLHELGKVHKASVWVPHQLTEDNKLQRVTTCMSLLSRHNCEPFLNRIIAADEKWVDYDKTSRKWQWLDPHEAPATTPKPDLHPKRQLLCVWWDSEGVIHFELLKKGETITATFYSSQLQRVHEELRKKRPALVNRKGVILQHDNARPHVAKLTQEKLKQLGWETLPHPPYSPDIAATDFHLFRSLQHHLAESHYDKCEDLHHDLTSFFKAKPAKFYKDGIDQLPVRWAKVVEHDGEYFTD
jgi:[histone H3]-lysine36 N-dimethyltransferase SETMAR